MRRAALALMAMTAAGGALGCSGVPDDPVQLRLRFAAGCEQDCADYPVSCRSLLSIRVVEADWPSAPDAGPPGDGGAATSSSVPDDELIASRCYAFGPPTVADDDETLCALRDLDIELPELPARMVRIQVAVWSEGELRAKGFDTCPPDNIFNLTGQPRYDFDPWPAFGGFGYFDLATADVAEVTLGCPRPDQLASCQGPRTLVNVTVTDLDTLLAVTETVAKQLRVEVAEPESRTVGETEEVEWYLDPDDLLGLSLSTNGPQPLWFQLFENIVFEHNICAQVLNSIVPQSAASVACRPVGTDDVEVVAAHTLSKDTLDQLLAAAGLTAVPAGGVVIGRVITRQGIAPVANVVVTPDNAPGAQVIYLSEDMQAASRPATSANGYFIATGVPFGTRWTAESDDGRQQQEGGPYIAGMVSGKISLLAIRMQPPITDPKPESDE